MLLSNQNNLTLFMRAANAMKDCYFEMHFFCLHRVIFLALMSTSEINIPS